jgi:hypothetical protein
MTPIAPIPIAARFPHFASEGREALKVLVLVFKWVKPVLSLENVVPDLDESEEDGFGVWWLCGAWDF